MTDLSFLEPPRHKSPLSERFQTWLHAAKAGEKFVYCSAPNLGDKSVTDDERAVAVEVRYAYAHVQVELYQRKRDDKLYDYTAVKRKERRVPKAHGYPWKPVLNHKPGYAGYNA